MQVLSILATLLVIACKTTVRVFLTEFTQIYLQANARILDMRKGSEGGDDKVQRVCKSMYLGYV